MTATVIAITALVIQPVLHVVGPSEGVRLTIRLNPDNQAVSTLHNNSSYQITPLVWSEVHTSGVEWSPLISSSATLCFKHRVPSRQACDSLPCVMNLQASSVSQPALALSTSLLLLISC
jgi:hypothetical protein